MSERHGSFPPDEPIIGFDYPLPPSSSRTEAPVAAPPPQPFETDWEDEEWDEPYDEDEYYDDYESDSAPARQPMFYAVLALAAVVGGVLIFLLFTYVKDLGGDDKAVSTPGFTADFDLRIDQPTAGERIEAGKETEVLVKATSNEPITKVQLLVNDRPFSEQAVSDIPTDRIYSFRFVLKLPGRGDYTLTARVTSQSKATKDSAKVRVSAYEPVGAPPVSVKGKVITTTVARTLPRDDAQDVRRLESGEEVKIIGKTRDNEWLLIDAGSPSGSWVKRAAIEEADSLALVPIRDANPTPVPATPTPVVITTPSPSVSPSPTATATVPSSAPDFVPTNAVLLEGGARLRVTVANLGTAAFTGAVEVSISGVTSDAPAKVAAPIPANGAVTVDFDLSPAITAQASVQVKVDPKNLVRETNEDNNAATFVLTPPAESPRLSISSATCTVAGIRVFVSNSGGDLNATTAIFRIKVSDALIEQPRQLAIAKGQAAVAVDLIKPGQGSGKATVQIFIGGQAVTGAVEFDLC